MTTAPATEAHERHMERLKEMTSTRDRRQYIEGVRQSEGKFAAKWLQDEFGKWWDYRERQRKV